MCLAASTRKPIYRERTKLRFTDSHIKKCTLGQLSVWFPPWTASWTTNSSGFSPILVTSPGASGMATVSAVEIRRMKVLVCLFPFIGKAKALLLRTSHGLIGPSQCQLLCGHCLLQRTLGKGMLSMGMVMPLPK